jgi:hypothetical protein
MLKRFNWRLITAALAIQFIGIQTKAQLSHFLYLQTDNKQPFYIKHNNKIISSTASGYIILSKLNDGEINFTVGFPQPNQPEHKFSVTIDRAEKGYLIKNFNEKGWGLFDLQSAAIVYAQTNQVQTTTNSNLTTTPPANDPFANMLSQVTQDSTVKTVTVKKEEKPVVVDTPKPAVVIAKVDTPQKKEVTVQTPPQKTEEPKKEQTPLVKTPIDSPKIQEPLVQQQPVQEPEWKAPPKSTVQRIRRFDSKEGSDLVFEVVETNGVRDTIRLFIAADTSDSPAPVTIEEKQGVEEPKKDTVVVTPLPQSELKILPETKKEEVKVDTPAVIKQEPKAEVKTEIPKSSTIPNSNCKDEATEDDFMKLRKRMAAQNKEEAMVTEAKKIFKVKCFSTSQLKNLAVLFLTDEWRYRFYDAALPHVSDFGSFRSLGDTITDDYYQKRFQALLPNQ